MKSPEGAIVFLLEKPQTLIFRLSKWIKRVSDKKIILAVNSRNLFFGKNEYFDEVLYFRNVYQLIDKLSEKKVFVIHAFAPPSNYMSDLIKKTNYRIIGDWKDISLNYYGFDPPYAYLKRDLPHEKYALENCHALIARSLEPKIAAHRYGIQLPKEKMLFLEYCDNDDFIEIKNDNYAPGELHLVYIGNVEGTQTKSPMNLKEVIEIITKQGIYLHVYPSQRVNEYIIEDYKKIERSNEYFILHKSIETSVLAQEISKYDFGIQPFFTQDIKRLSGKRKGSFTMKIFNYLESSLPIIIFEGPEFQNYFVRRYKIGISVNREEITNLKAKLIESDLNGYKRNIHMTREKFSYKQNIERLIDFYQMKI